MLSNTPATQPATTKGDVIMSKGNSNLFHGTLGTTVSGLARSPESYSDRGIEVPERVKDMNRKLPKKGSYITGSKKDFSVKDVSIMSKETGVEFAKVTIGDKSFLIRGDQNGAVIPNSLISKMEKGNSSFDYHSHPYDDDIIPSEDDIKAFRKICRKTGQTSSMIIAPNGKKASYNESGIVSVGTIENIIDNEYKAALVKLFGGTIK